MARRTQLLVCGSVALLALGQAACQPNAGGGPAPAADASELTTRIEEPSPARADRAVEIPATVPSDASASAARTTTTDGELPQTGRRCRVHLRRDALGLTSMAPLPLQASSPPARAAQVEGVLDVATEHWVVLRTAGRTYWIPTGVILAVEYPD